MISVIVFVPERRRPDPSSTREVLVRSLVWLVSAVVAGVVHDVTLAGPSGLGLIEIADQAGCDIVEEGSEASRLAAACAISKHTRLLIIESGFQPSEGFIGELDSYTRKTPPDAAARLLAMPVSPWQRLFPDRAPTIGMVASTARCRALHDHAFQGLVDTIKPRTRFETRAYSVR